MSRRRAPVPFGREPAGQCLQEAYPETSRRHLRHDVEMFGRQRDGFRNDAGRFQGAGIGAGVDQIEARIQGGKGQCFGLYISAMPS